MKGSFPKWSLRVLAPLLTCWIAYDFVVTDNGFGYYHSLSSPRFWIWSLGSITAMAVASLFLRDKFHPNIWHSIMLVFAMLSGTVTIIGIVAVGWAVSTRDLQLTNRELLFWGATLFLLTFLTIVCWVAYRRSGRQSRKGSTQASAPETRRSS
jgi:hypothetical protein